MKSLLSALPFIALTALCWGVYGPVLHKGQYLMGENGIPSSLRPLICVGIAYFIIAVIFPLAVLFSKGEKGSWTTTGFIWSFLAGAAGAVGALGIVLAFKFKGSPVFVMPLVFGCAPVVNTFVTMGMSRTIKQASAIFYTGVVIVALGAAGVMYFKPTAAAHDDAHAATEHEEHADSDSHEPDAVAADDSASSTSDATATTTTASETDASSEPSAAEPKTEVATTPAGPNYLMVSLFIGLTALCWGSYGPVLHKGQMKMQGSRLRPLLCVGLAYFAIAVAVPLLLMPAFPEPGEWGFSGVAWSLGGGAAGAIGALGIIYAFNFGGKPIFVMPLVFGCAPVVNTFVSAFSAIQQGNVKWEFVVSLGMVVLGAVMVLVFAPKPPHKPAPEAKAAT
ncbi:MAG: hypothetical protein KDA83_01890 [Planctomycetales bacterium]|nr:hypothetical protein [Planctomycetales bacterium]